MQQSGGKHLHANDERGRTQPPRGRRVQALDRPLDAQDKSGAVKEQGPEGVCMVNTSTIERRARGRRNPYREARYREIAAIRRRHDAGEICLQEAIEQMDAAGMTGRQFRKFIGVRKHDLAGLVSHLNDYSRCVIDVESERELMTHGWLTKPITNLVPARLAEMLNAVYDTGVEYPSFVAGNSSVGVAQVCHWAEYDTTFKLDSWDGWADRVEAMLASVTEEAR